MMHCTLRWRSRGATGPLLQSGLLLLLLRLSNTADSSLLGWGNLEGKPIEAVRRAIAH